MSAELADILARAEALVRKGWCQCRDAEDSAGNPVSPTAPSAARFDARGALRRASEDAGIPPELVLDDIAEVLDDTLRAPGVEKMGKLSIVGWNDRKDMTQAMVADGLRRAKEALQTNLAG